VAYEIYHEKSRIWISVVVTVVVEDPGMTRYGEVDVVDVTVTGVGGAGVAVCDGVTAPAEAAGTTTAPAIPRARLC
jgi:hypothetical protein